MGWGAVVHGTLSLIDGSFIDLGYSEVDEVAKKYEDAVANGRATFEVRDTDNKTHVIATSSYVRVVKR